MTHMSNGCRVMEEALPVRVSAMEQSSDFPNVGMLIARSFASFFCRDGVQYVMLLLNTGLDMTTDYAAMGCQVPESVLPQFAYFGVRAPNCKPARRDWE